MILQATHKELEPSNHEVPESNLSPHLRPKLLIKKCVPLYFASPFPHEKKILRKIFPLKLTVKSPPPIKKSMN